MATVLTGCGNSSEMPAESSKTQKEPITQESTEATVEDTEVQTSTSDETTTVVTTIPIEDRKPKVKEITQSYYDEALECDIFKTYRIVPEEATEVTANLGIITVDGRKFDITALDNVYGDEVGDVLEKQAGLYTTSQLIEDGVFDDVNIEEKWNPFDKKFICFQKNGFDVTINQKDFGLNNSENISDFVKAVYVDDCFRAIHSKSYAEHETSKNEDKEYIIVNGEEKTFVEKNMGYQLTENTDRRITFTDKDIAVGDGTTYGDIVAMFGAEPINVDADFMIGEIYTYRNSTVTVGFVFAFPKLIPELEYKEMKDLTEEQKNSLPLIAVYMWLND